MLNKADLKEYDFETVIELKITDYISSDKFHYDLVDLRSTIMESINKHLDKCRFTDYKILETKQLNILSK